VIPALNEESCVARVLKHLSTLDPPPAEIIVSVGDSADATAAIATEHGAKVVAGARGRSKQMNDGAAAASGDVVLFLHADTTVPSDAVTVARETFANDARVVAGGFVSLLERADKTFWFLSFHNVVKSFLYPALLKARPISHWSPYYPVRVVNADP
jgi:cellulose synthase/poly-beta-1,6-N-acetylglucosamine synthase-like glycosyltransferase